MSTAAQVAAKLRGIKLDASDIRRGLQAGALVIENEAKTLAPVRTGSLRRDIRTEVEADVNGGRARIGNTKAIPYAVHQEFGTSRVPPRAYLRGALRSTGGQAAKDVAEAIKQVIGAKAK